MTFHDYWRNCSAYLWPSLANHLWQATLFVLMAFAVSALLRRGQARTRYAVLLLALVKFLVPSALFAIVVHQLGIDISSPFRSAGTSQSVLTFFQIAEPLTQPAQAPFRTGAIPHSEFYCTLSAAWLAGFATLICVWWVRRRQFFQTVKKARKLMAGREVEALRRAQSLLGIDCDISLITSPQITEPGVWRVWKPVVALPERLPDHLSDSELEAVMTHELVHVTRSDNLASNLQTFVCSLFWFHPVVWILDRRLLTERERACDERVMELGGASENYANGLLKVLRFCLGWKMPGVSYATGSELKRRLDQIMANNRQKKSWHRLLVIGAVAGLILFSVATGLVGQGNAVAQNDRPGKATGSYTIMPARVPGAVGGGVSGGIAGGIQGGVSGAIAGGVPRGVSGGVAGSVPGGVHGGVAGGINGGIAGGVGGRMGNGAGSGSGVGIGGGVGIGSGVSGGVVGRSRGQQRVRSSDSMSSKTPRNRDEFKDKLEQAPTLPAEFENPDRAPLIITEAKVRALKWPGRISRGESQTDDYAMKPIVKLLNATDRRITAFWLIFTHTNSKQKYAPTFWRMNLEPHESYTFGDKPELGTYLAATCPAGDQPRDLVVKVGGAEFEDGSQWGIFPPP